MANGRFPFYRLKVEIICFDSSKRRKNCESFGISSVNLDIQLIKQEKLICSFAFAFSAPKQWQDNFLSGIKSMIVAIIGKSFPSSICDASTSSVPDDRCTDILFVDVT